MIEKEHKKINLFIKFWFGNKKLPKQLHLKASLVLGNSSPAPKDFMLLKSNHNIYSFIEFRPIIFLIAREMSRILHTVVYKFLFFL